MAPRKETPQDEREVESIQVRLQPVLGVKATTYVPVIWGLVLLVALFLLLLYPGLRRYGTLLNVESSPMGATVLIDGVRVGTSPVEAFVGSGQRVVTLQIPHHADIEETVSISGRRFASLLFPRRDTLVVHFRDVDFDDAFATGVREFGAWSLAGEPSVQFQHPPVARDLSRYLVTALDEEIGESVTARYLDALAPHSNEAHSTSVIGGSLLLASGGGLLGPDAIASLVQNIIRIEDESPGSHRLIDVYDPTIRTHRWYGEAEERYSTSLLVSSVALDEGRLPSVERLSAGPIEFVRVPAGAYVIGYPAREAEIGGRVVRFDRPFWMQVSETSHAEFGRFVAENTEWEEANRERLIQQSQVTSDYLADWNPTARTPLAGVSFYAVEAYVAWLNDESGYPRPEGTEFAIPTAEEWEYAAFLNDGAASGDGVGALSIPLMSGSLWEWTESWYARYGHLMPVSNGEQRVVMGGAEINDDAAHYLRGAQPPEWATPFLGFRVALRAVIDG